MINNVTGYSGFRSYGDKPISQLKPGQTKLYREYYKDATHEKADGAQLLSNYARFKSNYQDTQKENVQIGGYKVPAKSMNTMLSYEYDHRPELFNSTKLGRDQTKQLAREGTIRTTASMTLTNVGAAVAKNCNPTSHWQSTYKGITDKFAEKARSVSKRPLWSINRTAYSSSRGNYVSEFADSFGKHGHDPRSILNAESSKQENKANELSVGTTKTTNHIPGYNGFIPQTDINENCVEQSMLHKSRQTIIKQNIVENQAVKLPGYSGHLPMSVVNDRGSLRPNCLDTAGESFRN
jgi:hypothetical protein